MGAKVWKRLFRNTKTSPPSIVEIYFGLNDSFKIQVLRNSPPPLAPQRLPLRQARPSPEGGKVVARRGLKHGFDGC